MSIREAENSSHPLVMPKSEGVLGIVCIILILISQLSLSLMKGQDLPVVCDWARVQVVETYLRLFVL